MRVVGRCCHMPRLVPACGGRGGRCCGAPLSQRRLCAYRVVPRTDPRCVCEHTRGQRCRTSDLCVYGDLSVDGVCFHYSSVHGCGAYLPPAFAWYLRRDWCVYVRVWTLVARGCVCVVLTHTRLRAAVVPFGFVSLCRRHVPHCPWVTSCLLPGLCVYHAPAKRVVRCLLGGCVSVAGVAVCVCLTTRTPTRTPMSARHTLCVRHRQVVFLPTVLARTLCVRVVTRAVVVCVDPPLLRSPSFYRRRRRQSVGDAPFLPPFWRQCVTL